MKRKRARILAVLIVVAACVATVPFVPAAWKWLRYERRETVSADGSFGRMHFLRKRFDFLPGAYVTIPPQECAACSVDNHQYCFNEKSSRESTNFDPCEKWFSAFLFEESLLPGETQQEQISALVSGEERGLSDEWNLRVSARSNAADRFRCSCTHASHAGDD